MAREHRVADATGNVDERFDRRCAKPWVVEAKVNVVNQAFYANGNIATAGGCLSSTYLAAWIQARLKGSETAREVLNNFAPVGEKDEYVARAMAHIEAFI